MSVAALLLLTLPASSWAEKASIRGWYIGAGYSLTNVFVVEGDLAGNSERGSSDSGFTISGGYRFNRYLAAEIAYLNGGEPSFESTLLRTGEATEVIDVSISQKLDAFEASGLAILPFWRICEIYFRLGAAFWMADSKQVISVQGEESYPREVDANGVDLLVGVGAGVTPWKNLHLRLEVQAFRTSDDLLALDIDSNSDLQARFDAFIFEVQWRFGGEWRQ